MLSIIVPAYNESSRLPETLLQIRRHFDARPESYEAIVIDDGSEDGTAQYVAKLGREWRQLRLISLPHRRGKGWAVRAGMLAARGELRLFTDSDLSTPLEEYQRLRERIGGNCAVAIASRAVAGSRLEARQPIARELMGRLYNRMLQALALPGLRDTQCGFKLFTEDAAVACFRPLRTPGFGFDAEVLLRARRHGWEIAEVPVRWSHQLDSKVRPARDALLTLIDLFRLRFVVR